MSDQKPTTTPRPSFIDLVATQQTPDKAAYNLDQTLKGSTGPLELRGARLNEFEGLLSQTSAQERASLYAVVKQLYTGEGEILDIGTAAGGSSFCLAAGVLDSAVDDKVNRLQCFDLFGGYSLVSFKHALSELGLTFENDLELFKWQTDAVKQALIAHKIDITKQSATIAEVRRAEIVHIDAAKSLSLWTNIFGAIAGSVIPGKTIWIFQDFERCRLPWQVYGFAELLPFGEVIGGAHLGTIYFRFTKPIPDEVRARIVANRFSVSEMEAHIDLVIDTINAKYCHIFKDQGTLEDNRLGYLAYVNHWFGDNALAQEIYKKASRPFRRSVPLYAKEIFNLTKPSKPDGKAATQNSLDAGAAPSGIARETAVAKQVWEAGKDETNRQDQSHWRGVGRWANDKKWLNVGRSTRRKINLMARAMGAGPEYWAEPRTALEWGPGGGSNVLALSPFCETIYGVDISQKNLDECARMLGEEGYASKEDGTGYQPILVGEEPREVLKKVAQPLDVFTSIAVFQHFPSKDYGKQVLLTIREMCARRAFGVIQIRYDDGKERFRPIKDLAEYEAKHITANSYAIPEFYNLCGECGFDVMMITDIIDRSNSVTFGLRVK